MSLLSNWSTYSLFFLLPSFNLYSIIKCLKTYSDIQLQFSNCLSVYHLTQSFVYFCLLFLIEEVLSIFLVRQARCWWNPSAFVCMLLSRFSRVWLCATPQMAAHQAPVSLGFSRQEYWSGLPFPSPMHSCMLSHFSRIRLCVTLDSSPPGSTVHRILQARILE